MCVYNVIYNLKLVFSIFIKRGNILDVLIICPKKRNKLYYLLQECLIDYLEVPAENISRIDIRPALKEIKKRKEKMLVIYDCKGYDQNHETTQNFFQKIAMLKPNLVTIIAYVDKSVENSSKYVFLGIDNIYVITAIGSNISTILSDSLKAMSDITQNEYDLTKRPKKVTPSRKIKKKYRSQSKPNKTQPSPQKHEPVLI